MPEHPGGVAAPAGGDSPPKTRILALDHFFGQDLAALGSHPDLDVRRIPYQRLRHPALRMLGKEVGTGLVEFTSPRRAEARERYARWLLGEVRRLYLERSFDVFVLPSDSFFYVRDLPAAAHAIGVPVIVVQKETTISPDTMEDHSRVVGEFAPFVSDHMTVCSERHREFWLRTGAEDSRIVVTGQPRFDFYAALPPRREARVGRVLFFSYFLDAYQPGVAGGQGLRTWEPLRRETEAALVKAAVAGAFRLVVKRHPQQPEDGEEELLRELAGDHFGQGVTIADPRADTRELIGDADAVVGFQSTALYEAVAAGRRVVYAAWGSEFEEARAALIPFDQAPPGCLAHARSAAELLEFLDANSAAARPTCRQWVEAALGPIDGKATERTASELLRVARAWPPGEARATLDRGRRWFSVAALVRSTAAEATWTAATLPALIAGQQRRVNQRRQVAREQRGMAIEGLTSTSPNA